MYAVENIRQYDASMLSQNFGFAVEEDNCIVLDNTAEDNPDLLFKFAPTDKIEVLTQRNKAVVLKATETTLELSILNIGNMGTIKRSSYSWNRAECGVPSRAEGNDADWQGWICLLLVTDFGRGSPTFNPEFRKQLVYLIRRAATNSRGGNLQRVFPQTQIRVTLDTGIYRIITLDGRELYTTSDFKNLSIELFNELIAKMVLNCA